jgi:zinc transport system substrate-binding protein
MPSTRSKLLWAAIFWIAFAVHPAAATDGLKVVVTSKPVHSLTAGVMQGIGQPLLIVEGAASPHTFTLKPSAARAIQTADVFIRVSEQVEPFTEKLSKTLPNTVTLVTLVDTPGLELYKRRRGATFEQDGHAHAHHDDHDDADAVDGHVWLDPVNARKMVEHIATVLAAKSPANAQRLQANAAALAQRIEVLQQETEARMKPLAAKPFAVFHDATQYFERRFGLSAAGSITVSPDIQPSAKRLAAVRKRLSGTEAVCVFAEPAYNEKLMTAVTEGTKARAGMLDPEGLRLDPGPELYMALVRDIASSFEACLAPK